MKKLLIGAMVWALSGLCLAQSPSLTTPPPMRHSISFEAQRGEAFTVFLDGNEVNRMPQSLVLLNEVSSQTHEVVVVLKRPASKAAVLHLRPSEAQVKVSVSYSSSADCLLLYTPSYNRAESNNSQVPTAAMAKSQPQRQQSPTDTLAARPASDDDITVMAANMQKQPFDSDRLALGKVYVASFSLTAAQIARLAQVINYTASQVDFLKYAYAYCADKANYPQAITSLLPFSSDRQKVLDYIATQP